MTSSGGSVLQSAASTREGTVSLRLCGCPAGLSEDSCWLHSGPSSEAVMVLSGS